MVKIGLFRQTCPEYPDKLDLPGTNVDFLKIALSIIRDLTFVAGDWAFFEAIAAMSVLRESRAQRRLR